MRKFTRLICLLLIVSAGSCKKKAVVDENKDLTACGVKNPIQNLSWLNAKFKSLAGGSNMNGIVLYRLNGSEVIEIQGSVFSSTNQHQYYCDGTKLNLDEPSAFNEFKKERKLIGVLYGTNIWKDWK